MSKESLVAQIEKLDQDIEETKELLRDPSYKGLAEAEINRLEEERAALEEALEKIKTRESRSTHSPNQKKTSLKPKETILEIRAAAGGNEAGLFAADLYRMYQKFSQEQGWKVEELEKIEGGIGNIKEASLKISPKKGSLPAKSPFQLLKHEAGVHRVQRVPGTEKSGRIHTSTVTIVVLPVIKEADIKIDPRDLKVETFRSSGPGGQHMQKTESAVRITHRPTGISAFSQEARHQQANREKAHMVLCARLYQEMQRQQKESIDQIRAEAVGSGERAEKIRTYNFPQNRVTDHRIKKSWHNLEEILEGNLTEILEELAESSITTL